MRSGHGVIRLASVVLVVCLAATSAAPSVAGTRADGGPETRLVGRAVLPARTFAPGPTSGTLLGPGPINGVEVPFRGKQPVQGFSAVLNNRDGTFSVMSDNGFGTLENSADFNLRVHRIRPHFETATGGSGDIDVLSHIQLRDPKGRVPFAITNDFSKRRILTGADFDIESMRRARDGTLWFGDEFGPFLLHTSASGVVLEPPVPLPDFSRGGEVRSPQNPFNEESSTVRVMNAMRAHAQKNGAVHTPIVSPWELMLADGDPSTFVPTRESPPPGSGLRRASSEIHDVASIHAAGFPVVPYTINDPERMQQLLDLDVDGIISDDPEALYETVAAYDADGDGTGGDYLLPDGRIDRTAVDAQGHRGARALRPENSLPAMEAGLDNLMTTLETDTGITRDHRAVLDHDPFIDSAKCRRADGRPYEEEDEVLVKSLSLRQIQSRFICDKLILSDFPEQRNDRSLSPVAVAFANKRGLIDPYVMPTLRQLFRFVRFYERYYRTGPGRNQPDAELRANNAARVGFNVETKLNPRREFASRTVGPRVFTNVVGKAIRAEGLRKRASIQSFDWRTLLLAHRWFPAIQTVCLFGDFPKVGAEGDGTNLQPDASGNTPWLAGLEWPYLVTALTHPFRAERSAGFEGMAITKNGERLRPLLEKPLAGDPPRALKLHAFDISRRAYTGRRWTYRLNERGESIGDFTLFARNRGLVIERDSTQGDLGGFKAIYEVTFGRPGTTVAKNLRVDLLDIADPNRISEPGLPGDVGIGRLFAFPFETIEDVVALGSRTVGVLNDNNFPFSVGRHVGTGRPDDNEFIRVRLSKPLFER